MFEKRNDLVKFLAVVETGAILAAADKLGITQPALSRVVARLERQFGGRLFDRMSTGVRLTPVGAVAADLARHILYEIEAAEEKINATLAGRTGSLRITAGPMWMRVVLPVAIARFHETCPGMEIKLKTTPVTEGIRLLVNGESDFHCGGINTSEPLPQFLKCERFLDMTWGIVAHRDHPLHSSAVREDALADYPWIDFDAPMRANGRGGTAFARRCPRPAPRQNGQAGEDRHARGLLRPVPDGSGALSVLALAHFPREIARTPPQTLADGLRRAPLPGRHRVAALVRRPGAIRAVPRHRARGGGGARRLSSSRRRRAESENGRLP